MKHDVYIVIGNTDGKLSSEEWQNFQTEFKTVAESAAEKIWGTWYSDPTTPYHNMCIGLLLTEANTVSLRSQLSQLASRYHQDSIAWSDAKTELIKPE